MPSWKELKELFHSLNNAECKEWRYRADKHSDPVRLDKENKEYKSNYKKEYADKDYISLMHTGCTIAELEEISNERHQKLDLIIGLIPHLYQKINDLEKRLEEVEDQCWMNHDSGVPSEKISADEILESVQELSKIKLRRI